MSALNVTVTLFCLVAFSLEVIGFFFYYILKKRPDRISFIKNYKKGKCAIIYLIAIPMFWIGIMYTKTLKGVAFTPVNEIFTSIHKVINLVVLKYEVTEIEALMNDFKLYAACVYVCFGLVLINAGLFTVSFVGQYLWSLSGKVKRRLLYKENLVIFGYNNECVEIYKSDKSRAKIVVAPLTREQTEELYLANIHYAEAKSYEAFVERFIKFAKNEKKHTETLIKAAEIAQRKMRDDAKYTTALEKALFAYPQADKAADIMFDLAYSYEKQGKTAQAKEMYKKLIIAFPTHRLASRAQGRIAKLEK